MRLGGRLTGHFLARVALLLVALGAVFLGWILVLSYFTIGPGNTQATRVGTSQIVRQAAQETTLSADGRPVFSEDLVADAAEAGIWLQVLDESGVEIASTPRPADVPSRYTPGQLVLYRQTPGEIDQQSVSTWATRLGTRDLTFVAGMPRSSDSAPALFVGKRVVNPEPPTIWTLLGALLLAGGATTIGVAWLTGRSLARPPVHMMAWLAALARGEYAEPTDKRGRPVSRTVDGRALRKPYATYREVFASLDRLTAELRSTAEERTRIEAARDEWLASVSHDLRTPLTSVKGYAQMLASEHEFDAEEVRRQAALIATQASHMDALLDDMNLSFRLRSDALVLERRRVDLIELVREAAVDLANDPRAAGRSVVFEEPPGTGAITVHADASLLRRALANLLVNAAVHNPAGTTVRVSVAHEGAWAIVRVTDDGVGMDEATRARLFDRYFRGTSTGSAEGTGLGMAITREIALAHSGSIDVASTRGAGTTVQIALPAAESGAESSAS